MEQRKTKCMRKLREEAEEESGLIDYSGWTVTDLVDRITELEGRLKEQTSR